MKTIKCTHCGMTNWSDASSCKRCKKILEPTSASAADVVPRPLDPLRQPSVLKIIRNDMIALLGALLPILGWGAGIAGMYFGFAFQRRPQGVHPSEVNDTGTFLVIAIGSTIVGVVMLVLRLIVVNKLLASGERIFGTVAGIGFVRDRGRVEYSYSYQRREFRSGAAIMKNRATLEIRPGDRIVVVVDPASPGRALMEDLYY